MSMTTLQVYNQMLAAINESPVSDVQTESYIVAELSPYLERARQEVQAEGWKFNTDEVTLSPDVNGDINIGTDTLRIIYPNDLNYITERDSKLWNPKTASKYSTAITVLRVTDLSFTAIPFDFQKWIAAEAALKIVMVKAPEVSNIYFQEARNLRRKALNTEDHDLAGVFGVNNLIGGYAI